MRVGAARDWRRHGRHRGGAQTRVEAWTCRSTRARSVAPGACPLDQYTRHGASLCCGAAAFSLQQERTIGRSRACAHCRRTRGNREPNQVHLSLLYRTESNGANTELAQHTTNEGGGCVACVAGWLLGLALVCAFVCVPSCLRCGLFRGLFACVLSWVEILIQL